MATLSPTESRRMYSWWWDSHISPKNSKWLRENLTDMDSKVKAMIKLIEEDADSFARRAEMYYEKRPELMKLVEGFYRAYRALAERYGHATGAIRQTIAEAFPDEVLFEPDELQKGTCGIPLSHFEAETETQSTKNDLSRSEAGNEPWLLQHKQSLELVSKLESEFLRADKAETEVGNLKRALSVSTDEKDSAFKKICNLEHEISCIQEEAQRLNEERDGDIAKLKDAEERYILKLGAQNEELREKQKEVGRLRGCIQEERVRFMEAETAFQNLQHMYSHSQEELRSLTAELQNVGQILKDMETRNQGLQDEVKEVKEENRSLSERNLSLDEAMRKMQDETSKLRAIKLHLEEKIGLRVDQRNALQKEVYCLQGELNRLNKKLCMLIEQVDSVGLNPECLGSSVKELQDESSKLREICQSERSEKAALLEKLEILKNSLSDMSVELEEHRTKVKALEESCHLLVGDKLSLVAEKDAVVSQLQSMSQNFEKLSEKHGFLENSFSYAHFELEELREKFRGLENSCQFLDNENVGLISERSTLASQFEITQQKVEDLENKYTNLEERHCGLENDKESVLQKLEELSLSLDVEKKEHERFTQSSETRLVSLETQILLLQEESLIRKREIEGGLDEALNAQIEIFILQRCVQDLEEKNSSLLIDCEEFSRMCKLSEQLVSELQHENLEQQMEFKSLNDHIRNLRKINEEMTLKLSEQDHKERLLAAGTEDLHEKLLALQRAYRDLKRENFKVLEQKRSLEEQNHSLEEENCVNLGEALSLSSLSVVLMNFAAEKSVDQNAIRERVNFLEKNLEMLKIENFHLKKSFENSENQLKTEKFVSDQLKHEIAYNKDLLYQKGVEILEAEQKLIAMQNEKRVWHKMLEDLKREFDEANMKREDHAQQILKLAQDNDRWNKENECLHEAIRRLEANLQKSHIEHEATKTREESLSSDLKKGRNEVKLCQNQAAALFSELQAYAVREIFFEEKIHELSEACENFTERVSTLEGENGGLKSQLASYLPAIAALKDSITSLENHTISHTKFHSADNLQTKDVEGSHPYAKSCHIYGLRDLHELKTRIVVADKAMREMDRVAEQESLKSNAKLEAAMRQIEESQSQSDMSRENVQTRNHQAIEDLKLLKPMPEICEAGTELLTKDIVLDQISKCSSYRRRRKRANARGADKALEIWQATDQKNSIDLTVGEGKNTAAAAPTGKQLPSMGVMIEKELGMDLLEISKGFRAQTHQGGNKRKILERLASDAQKLTNLGITVQDLKRKMENTEKGKKGKSIEYDTVKLQLEEAEETIQKLFSINGKLTKSVQDNFSSRNGKSKMEPEESGSVRRRRVSEQARRGSEKIMQLQLEVQKIQFILLKLDDEKEHKARIRIPERKPRVLLRDYLSGGFRTNVKQKKARCCSCVQPPTRGD